MTNSKQFYKCVGISGFLNTTPYIFQYLLHPQYNKETQQYLTEICKVAYNTTS